jgi:hypothetical protein
MRSTYLTGALGALIAVGLPFGHGVASQAPEPMTPPGGEPAAARSQSPTQDATLAERLRDELELLEARIETRTKALELEKAQREAALAEVVKSMDHRELHRPGRVVNIESIRQAEQKAGLAVARVEALHAELKELELLRDQARRAEGHSDQIATYLERLARTTTPPALEHRLAELERKLDQILGSLERLIPKAAPEARPAPAP